MSLGPQKTGAGQLGGGKEHGAREDSGMHAGWIIYGVLMDRQLSI